jgi:hypothetical protein
MTRWGKAEVRVKRWYCTKCQHYGHSNGVGLDGSGLSPAVLASVIYLGSHLSYRESQEALRLQRIELSLGYCEQKHHAYAEVYEAQCKSQLKTLADQPLASNTPKQQVGQIWVLEADGMFVMERDKPCPGQCEGREVKQAVLFPLRQDKQRHYLAHAGDIATFAPLVHGLQRQLGMTQQDTLIAVADGAAWLDGLFEDIGVRVRILDVFHATQYLETVMLALGWQEDKRLAQRCSWVRGDINARVWLKHYLPEPDVWLTWSQPAQAALQYLETRLDQMDYFDFKEKGYPIGSGVIEGAASSVIAARMRRSGMRWSHSGLNRMATLRAEFASFQPILDFNAVRLLAFP